GWSKEWRLAVLKITDAGPRPHADIDQRTEIPAGGTFAALVYEKQPDGRHFEPHPQTRLRDVVRSSPPYWFAASSTSSFAPLFSLEGRLIGFSTKNPVGGEASCTPANLLVEHWKALSEGANLDRDLLAGDTSTSAQQWGVRDSSDNPAD